MPMMSLVRSLGCANIFILCPEVCKPCSSVVARTVYSEGMWEWHLTVMSFLMRLWVDDLIGFLLEW